MDITLLVHIATSVATLLISSFAWYKPSINIESYLNKFSLISIITGLLVSLGQPLTLAYCAKLGLYLSAIIATKYMLFIQSKRNTYDQNRG
jgi:hypothetical protein